MVDKMEILWGETKMILIWFIGMYVIFILQQITILYLLSRGGKKWLSMMIKEMLLLV